MLNVKSREMFADCVVALGLQPWAFPDSMLKGGVGKAAVAAGRWLMCLGFRG